MLLVTSYSDRVFEAIKFVQAIMTGYSYVTGEVITCSFPPCPRCVRCVPRGGRGRCSAIKQGRGERSSCRKVPQCAARSLSTLPGFYQLKLTRGGNHHHHHHRILKHNGKPKWPLVIYIFV